MSLTTACPAPGCSRRLRVEPLDRDGHRHKPYRPVRHKATGQSRPWRRPVRAWCGGGAPTWRRPR